MKKELEAFLELAGSELGEGDWTLLEKPSDGVCEILDSHNDLVCGFKREVDGKESFYCDPDQFKLIVESRNIAVRVVKAILEKTT